MPAEVRFASEARLAAREAATRSTPERVFGCLRGGTDV